MPKYESILCVNQKAKLVCGQTGREADRHRQAGRHSIPLCIPAGGRSQL